ncbi:MAG: hypothetical protein RI973_537 [Bacteroidota bacterium]|jgi:hypothetical protein
MKNIKKYLLIMLVVVLGAPSCTDFVEPAIPYSDFDTGTYLRTLKTNSLSFNYFDLNNAFFSVIVEAVDADGGKSVNTVTIYARHRRGQTLSAEVEMKKISASEFQPAPFPDRNFPLAPERDFPWVEIRANAAETLSKLGLSEADINGGDFFEYRLELLDTKGRTFTNTNLSGDIAGGAFYNSPFFYRVPVICPSDLAGTFDFVTTDIAAGPGGDAAACGGEKTGQVTLTAVAGSPGVYNISDASFGVFDCAWGDTPPAGTVRFNDACGKISFTGTDKYGDAYSLTFVSNDGTNLVIKWTNTYGDGGTTTIKANSGKPWPPNLK